MDTGEHEEHGPVLDIPTAVTLDATSDPLTIAAVAPTTDRGDAAPRDETVFTVLATRVRTRAPAHLWITAAVGAIDAVALLIARPTLWWVAAACAAVTAYAAWGLADRALSVHGPTLHDSKWLGLETVRGSAIVVGVAATAVTVFGFVGAALGRGTLGW